MEQKRNIQGTTLISIVGLMTAMSVILVYLVHFPIIPVAPFLEYDPADIPILIGGFAFGPLVGFLLTIVTCLVQGITVSSASGFYGILMHVLSTGTFVLTSSIIYNKYKSRKGAYLGLIAGSLAMTAIMIPANYIITPLFLHVPIEAVTDIVLYIVLFNLFKASINSLFTFLLYKRISRFIHNKYGCKS